jgi:hypothetical protein
VLQLPLHLQDLEDIDGSGTAARTPASASPSQLRVLWSSVKKDNGAPLANLSPTLDCQDPLRPSQRNCPALVVTPAALPAPVPTPAPDTQAVPIPTSYPDGHTDHSLRQPGRISPTEAETIRAARRLTKFNGRREVVGDTQFDKYWNGLIVQRRELNDYLNHNLTINSPRLVTIYIYVL